MDDVAHFATRLTDGQALIANNIVIITNDELISRLIKGLHSKHIFVKGHLSRQLRTIIQLLL